MNKFQVNDIVVRIHNSFKDVVEGNLYVVKEVGNERLLLWDIEKFNYNQENFILWDGLDQVITEIRREIDGNI